MTHDHRRPTRSILWVLAIAGIVLIVPAHTLLAQGSRLALGIDTTNFDRSVRPQDDFYHFVNGGWIARTPIPDDASSWGAFNELREKSRAAMHDIVEAAAKSNAPAGSERRKIGDIYSSYMDSTRIETLGLTPIQPELRVIAAITTTADLPAAFAHFSRLGVTVPVAVGVGSDPMASSVNIVSLTQSGLGMPDRDYYLATDAKMRQTQDAYVAYTTRLLTLAKQPDAIAAAARIVALETVLAQKQWDRARSRDRNATYNRMSVAKLETLSPKFGWTDYLKAAGLGATTEVIVRQPDFVAAADSIVAATPVAVWRAYLTAKLLDAYANELPGAFQEAHFDFRNKTLQGQPVNTVRWKRGVDEVETEMGEAAGKIYIEQDFKPAAKARMDAMIKSLRAAYQVGIDSLDWMSPATKAQAKAKLAKFTVKIAYPDQWRDFGKLEIRAGDALGNAMRAHAFTSDVQTSQLGKPVDRSRWTMTPQTVNAYYSPNNNEIVFPAAILQPPFFDVDADDAVNYGAIGAVIGHEIGHGFDDQGRKSDGDGNLRDWWTPADASAFEAKTARLGAQYSAINPIDNMHINGQQTMGENIGDLSGLAQAYRAYHISLAGKPAPVIGGFTGDQRFFLGFAQIWRTNIRDAALRQQLLSDAHSPGAYRAFVPLVNNDAFVAAFDVKPGDRMYRAPADRVRIW